MLVSSRDTPLSLHWVAGAIAAAAAAPEAVTFEAVTQAITQAHAAAVHGRLWEVARPAVLPFPCREVGDT